MRISRAIGRVKRQAKQGMAGLGEGLQSAVVPRPLRGAARRIAELLGAKKAAGRARKEPARTHVAASSAPYQPQVLTDTPDHVTFTGTDSGAEPNDEPRDDTPVDPRAVGATPTYNATPIEVAPVEVTPVDATPVDATPVEITAATLAVDAYAEVADAEVSDAEAEGAGAKVAHHEAREAKPAATKKPAAAPKSSKQPSRGGNGNAKKRAAATAHGPAAKEKVAATGEAAKTLARSGSGAPKKRSGPRTETTKKK